MNADHEDERILDEAMRHVGREAYQEHMDRATRNLSVEVVDALNKRRKQRLWVVRISVAATATAAAVIMMFVNTPQPVVVEPIIEKPVAVVSEPSIIDTDTETLAAEYLSDVIDEQSIDRIVEVAEVEPTILTDKDIDVLLEEM